MNNNNEVSLSWHQNNGILHKQRCLLIVLLCLMITGVHSYAGTIPPEERISINKKNASLEEVIHFIEKKSSYSFWFREDIPAKTNKITVAAKDASIEQVLDICVRSQPFTYRIIDHVIVLVPDSTILHASATALLQRSSAKKMNFTGTDGFQKLDPQFSSSSFATMDSKQIDQTVGGNIFSNNSVSGLQMTTDAKGNSSMLIRGRSSIMSGTDPLIMLDGMPYQGDIKQINPATIANVTVLKDAGATSIYGSRGANGVIVITSKNAAIANAEVHTAKNTISKKGDYYYYEGTSVYSLFKHLEARYAVAVSYQTNVPAGFYRGRLPAALSSDQMLAILYSAGIRISRERASEGSKNERIIVY